LKTNTHRNKSLSIILLAVFSLLVTACNPKIAKEIRRHTYPPEFNYIPEKEFKSIMWRFAEKVKQLNEVMREANLSGDGPKREVVRILSEMEKISMDLGPEAWPGNHPKVARHITMFRSDLLAARRALDMDPPNYYLAGSIAGACSHCHRAK